MPPPALVRRAEAARICGTGTSTWDRLTAAGLTPQPVKLGGGVMWRRDEILAWIDAGCPDRAAWAAVWKPRNGTGPRK